MSAKLSLLVDADAKQAKAELDSTGKAVDKIGSAAQKMGRDSRSASSGTRNLGVASRDAANQVRALAQAEQMAAGTTRGLGNNNRIAAGSVSNLTAQFNDLGVMLAAGQNPLQLALQQGTQITQVIGPMGATGAVRALGAAFLQMLNPVSLITIGSIAAGAAMVGWLRSASPEAVSLDDAMEDLEAGIDAYARAARAAGAPTDELKEKFGEASAEAKLLLADLAEASFRDRRKEIVASFQGLSDELGLSHDFFSQGDRRRIIASDFDLSTQTKENREFIDSFIKDITDFSNAANLPIEAQIAAIDQLVTSYRSAAEASGSLSDEEAGQLRSLQQIQIDLLELQELRKSAGNKADEKALEIARSLLGELENEVVLQATIATHGKDSVEASNERLKQEREAYALKVKELPLAAEIMAMWDQANPKRDAFEERLQAAYAYYGATRRQSDLDKTAADEMLAKMREENAIRAAEIRFGKDSAEVNELRRASEQRVYEAMLTTLNYSESTKDELRAAFQASQDLNYANMSDGIRAASQYASELVNRIVAASGAAQSLARQGEASLKESELRVTYAKDPVKLAGELARLQMGAIQAPLRDGANAGETAYLDQQLKEFVQNQEQIARNNQKRVGTGGGAGGIASDALAELIARERDELAILREYDPVQKEMLKNRKALSGATDEERAAVESLIGQRIQEQIRVDALQESYDFWGQTTLGIFDDLFVKGKSLNDVIGNLASSLASAAWQATILGTGPLASMVGTAGSGGLFGSLFGGLFGQKRAGGGLIDGEGGPTEDRVLTFTSPGEYVVKASQTARHLPLLEAINSGSLDRATGFANGGMIGTAPMMLMTAPPVLNSNGGQAGGSGRNDGLIRVELSLSDDLDGRIVEQSAGVAVRVVRAGLEQFSSESLPVRFKEIANDERAIG